MAESVLPVLAGGVVGFLLGQVGGWLFARATLPVPVRLPVSASALEYATAALFGAVGAGLLAVRGDLARPAADLLRRTRGRARGWRSVAGRAVLGVLAVVAAVEVRSSAGQVTGLGLVASALIAFATALVLAGMIDSMAGRLARRALRRGRLGRGLGLAELARGQTSYRVTALTIVAVALFGYAATASDVAGRALHEQAAMQVGAGQVLTVTATAGGEDSRSGALPSARLLYAVREADPDGRFAMAVQQYDVPERGLIAAVDATRLASVVATWPRSASGLTATRAAGLLHPPTDPGYLIRGTGLALDTESGGGTSAMTATITVTGLDGGTPVQRTVGPLDTGLHQYRTNLDCAAGCRLGDIVIVPGNDSINPDAETRLTLRAVRQLGPTTLLVRPGALAAWQVQATGDWTVLPAADGLRLLLPAGGAPGPVRLVPPDRPENLPTINTEQGGSIGITLWTGQNLATVPVGRIPAIPGVAGVGCLVDLEYLSRYGDVASTHAVNQVWLAANAPADAEDRLRGAGLTILSRQSLAGVLAGTAQEPGTIGLRFFLYAAALALVLCATGLVVTAGVERPVRADGLRWLRTQGLPRRIAVRAGLVSYLGVVLSGCLLGAVAWAAAWLALGEDIPVFPREVPGVVVPRWPRPVTAVSWGIAATVLVAVAVGLTVALARAVNRPRGGRDGGNT
jgi:hypothetical protein